MTYLVLSDLIVFVGCVVAAFIMMALAAVFANPLLSLIEFLTRLPKRMQKRKGRKS